MDLAAADDDRSFPGLPDRRRVQPNAAVDWYRPRLKHPNVPEVADAVHPASIYRRHFCRA